MSALIQPALAQMSYGDYSKKVLYGGNNGQKAGLG
jgi:hypothetical protein